MKTRVLLAIANYLMVGAPIICYALATDKPYWTIAFAVAMAMSAYYKDFHQVLRLRGIASTVALLLCLAYGVSYL